MQLEFDYSIVNAAFNDGSLRSYIEDNLSDPWTGTLLQGYVHLSPLQKGEFGERLVSKLLELKDMHVVRPSQTFSGFDRLIDGIKTEIKFSVALRDGSGNVSKDSFFVNHVSKDKDWERVIFLGLNDAYGLENRFMFFTKEDFVENVDSESSPFRVQQSGNKGGNDDYFVPSANTIKFLSCSWIRHIDEW